MTVQLSMVGLMVRDMPAALAFYRRLGMDIPADAGREGLRPGADGERRHDLLGHLLDR